MHPAWRERGLLRRRPSLIRTKTLSTNLDTFSSSGLIRSGDSSFVVNWVIREGELAFEIGNPYVEEAGPTKISMKLDEVR